MSHMVKIGDVADVLLQDALSRFDAAKHEEANSDRLFRSRIIRAFRLSSVRSLTLDDLYVIMQTAGYPWMHAEFIRLRTQGVVEKCPDHPAGQHLRLKPGLL